MKIVTGIVVFSQRLKEKWQKTRQTFARITLDRRNRAIDEWRRNHPKEYAMWLVEGCPEIFIYKPIITYEDELDE